MDEFCYKTRNGAYQSDQELGRFDNSLTDSIRLLLGQVYSTYGDTGHRRRFSFQ